MSRRPARAEVPPDASVLADLLRLAKSDPSAKVRLALASVLQRLPLAQREAMATALVGHAEDAGDHNLPLLIWYGLIPLAEAEPASLARIAASCELPATRRLIARRLAELLEPNSPPIDALLRAAIARDPGFQTDLVRGLADGLKGWRKAAKPAAWDAFSARLSASADPAVRDRLRDLTVLFGDGRSIDELRQVALDPKVSLTSRETALRTFIAAAPPDLRPVCERLLGVRFLNAVAVEGLARLDDPEVGRVIAASFNRFDPSRRDAIVQTLLSRPSFVKALLAEIAGGGIPRAVLTPYQVRQIRGFGDAALTAELTAIWGESREPAVDKRELIRTLKTQLTPETLARADKGQGRAVYAALCSACHTLYGHGGKIGPDLTGSGRHELDYLLENLVDPGANLSADFRLQVITLKDGRTFSGRIVGRTPRTLTLQGVSDEVTVEQAEIATRQEIAQSMMPEGLLESLPPEQQRDLIAYLMHPTQVPLPDRSSSREPAQKAPREAAR